MAESTTRFGRAWRWAALSPVALAVFCAVVALYGLARINQATPNDLGLIGDSFYYVTGAENLAAGRGFGRLNGSYEFVPTTHYPPGYSAAMAGVQLLGAGKIESAVWVNYLSYFFMVIVAAATVRQVTDSNAAGAVSASMLALSPVLLQVSVWVMSEATFLALSMAALFCLARYLGSMRKSWLVLIGVFALASYLTRYAGLALLGAMALTLLTQSTPRHRRLVDSAVFGFIVLLPLTGWLVRNALLTGNLANRDVLWNPVGYEFVRALVLHVLAWIVPTRLIPYSSIRAAILVIVVIGSAVVGLRLLTAGKFQLRGSLEATLTAHAVIYCLALAASISLFDAATPVDHRILSPVFVSLALLGALLTVRLWSQIGMLARFSVAFALAAILFWNGYEQRRVADEMSGQVLGYSATAATSSDLVQAVRDLPQIPIYSNGLSSLYFWADRYVYALPVRVDVESGQPREDYPAHLETMRKRMREDAAMLVIFNPAQLISEYGPIDELTEGLSVVAAYPDGVIYRYAGFAEEGR